MAVVLAPSTVATSGLTLKESVTAQRAIEQVYWDHRIWPKENAVPKASPSVVLPDDEIRARAEDTIRKSNALETSCQRPVTPEQLQAEFDLVGEYAEAIFIDLTTSRPRRETQ